MPDSDTDSVARTMEGSGPFDPTVLATTPKKRKSKKQKKSRKKRKNFANTGSDTSSNHSSTGHPIDEASIEPVLPEEVDNNADNNTNESTEQVVLAVPVVTQTTLQKKKWFVWSFSIDPDLPNFLIDDNNYQDELLIRCIVQESPWRAKHGAKKTSWESVMSLLANQQHELANVFDGATLITIRRRYEGYMNLAKMWTSEREKHNQEEKSEDEEPDAESTRTRKQVIKQGIMDMYEDVRLFKEEIKNGKRANEEKEAMEKAAAEKIRQAAIGMYYYSIVAVFHEF